MDQKGLNLVLQNILNEVENSQTTADLITNIVSITNEIHNQTIVIKVASNILDNTYLLESFVDNIHLLSECGANIIIVHDYIGIVGKTLTAMGFKDKHTKKEKDSYVEDFMISQMIEMVISGHVNKKLVYSLCKNNYNVIGISGKDANLIEAKKQSDSCSTRMDGGINLGLIALPTITNPEILLTFEEANVITVVSPIACSDTGTTYLLDVDHTASLISVSMGANILVLMHDEGSLKNNKKITGKIENNNINKLLQGKLSYSMKNILKAGQKALDNNVKNFYITDSHERHGLLYSIFLQKHIV